MKDFMSTDFTIEQVIPYYIYMTDQCISPLSARTSYALSVNLNGNSVINVFGVGDFANGPGDITFLPSGSSYAISVSKNYDEFCVAFRLKKEIPLKPFIFCAQNNPKLIERFKTLYRINAKQNPGYKERLNAELYNIIYDMKTQYFNEYMPKEKQRLIQPAIDYIDEHISETVINVETLAQLCGVSPVYLRRIFKSLYGVSPVRYANNRQMNKAKDLLNTELYSVSQISQILGYEDISQFSHKFKTIVGISPSDYKKYKAP